MVTSNDIWLPSETQYCFLHLIADHKFEYDNKYKIKGLHIESQQMIAYKYTLVMAF